MTGILYTCLTKGQTDAIVGAGCLLAGMLVGSFMYWMGKR